jgi:CHC2 zinc finger
VRPLVLFSLAPTYDWRRAHANIVRFWNKLENAAHRAMRSGLPVEFSPFTFAVENDTLYMTLPSGRRLAYPQAQLRPGKFEGTRVINCERGASEDDIWRGLLVENAVQSISRDLLAGAMLRLDAAGFRIVLHCHDEAVCEVPEDFDTMEFLQLMTELPDWAKGLSLADLINEPVVDDKIVCPTFHSEKTPSLHVYADHFHCFGCGAHGDRIDWLTADCSRRQRSQRSWPGKGQSMPVVWA